MASRKKKNLLADAQSCDDPKGALDSALLLGSAQPVVKLLETDLLDRAKASPAVTRALRKRHEEERRAERTADPYDTWLRAFVVQVAAAWVLSCVFVRVLEDRGLLGKDRNRIAGPGALDSQQLFFQLAPSLSERDYLLTVFRELAQFPAAAGLFDARHNPVWLLSPSAEGCRSLLALFRTPNESAPALRFGQDDTRFLGDLYQDLSEDVRKRYALLQTPDFVEEFILDRTLDRAIERFGLDEATLIDPTCGSGHFLLGAFARLLEHRQRAEPGVNVRDAAMKALGAVSGADINPYAVAIARFRLTLAYLDAAKYERIANAPELPIHLVVADSLLHNPQGKTEHATKIYEQVQLGLGEAGGVERTAWEGDIYALDDEAAARDVLYRRYAAVVGNPPYITVKDKALRDRYRAMYASCHREYSLAVPFAERFFQLAREGGAVGMITANSFMKREFGKKLIEEFFPKTNLDLIVNTSGAYIPGHGTPTVLLFGTSEPPQADAVPAVLAKRGEPRTPQDPAQGEVWSSVAGNWNAEGFENEYVSVGRVERSSLAKHPWSLAGGGAGELKALLEERSERTLGDVVDVIGFGAVTREDDVFLAGRGPLERAGVRPAHMRDFVSGENVRDWAVADPTTALWPYDPDSFDVADDQECCRFAWPFKRQLSARVAYGKTQINRGLRWFEYSMFFKSRFRTPLSITFAFVATHNHFVLDRGGKVFNRTAPIIKLPEGATEDDHLALLAYLNSSTACFWMKQVFYPKSSASGDISKEKGRPEAERYEFAGTGLQNLPIPALTTENRVTLRELATDAIRLATAKEELSPAELIRRVVSSDASPRDLLAEFQRTRDGLSRELLSLQEEIDWEIYSAFGLTSGPATPTELGLAGLRPFEATVRADVARGWAQRWDKARVSSELRMLEDSVYKRLWMGRRGVFGHGRGSFTEHLSDAAEKYIQDLVEGVLRERIEVTSAGEVLRALSVTSGVTRVAELIGSGAEALTTKIAKKLDSVPCLAAHRYTESGLEKRSAWEHTWELQRKEDAGESVGDIPVPPKYAQKDFRDAGYWRLRGKLDVPKERFISYPGCESDEDGEPVYGWAGWNHLEQAQALAALYESRKAEGWEGGRLAPMLAGLLELLPWLVQWHNEPSDEFDGMRLGEYFASYLDGECARYGLSHDELRAFRPPEKRRAAKKKNKSASKRNRRATPTESGNAEAPSGAIPDGSKESAAE